MHRVRVTVTCSTNFPLSGVSRTLPRTTYTELDKACPHLLCRGVLFPVCFSAIEITLEGCCRELMSGG